MKNNKSLIIIAIVFLNLLAGIMVGKTFLEGNKVYKDAMSKAQSLADENLCVQAAEQYKIALAEEDSIEVRKQLIDVYRNGIDSGEFKNQYDIFTEVVAMIDENYSEDPKMYEFVCDFLADYEQYSDCVKLLKQAKSYRVQSKELDKVRESIRYMHDIKYSMYSKVYPEYDGAYLAKTDGDYRFLNADSTGGIDKKLLYATPFAEGYALVKKIGPDNKEATYIINKEGIRQTYFDNVIKSSTGVGKYKSGETVTYAIACEVNGEYKYYDVKTGDPIPSFESYRYAGRFRNEVAAVETDENQWRIITGEGKHLNDTVYSDIILNEFGDCAPRGYIFASTGGKYSLYLLNDEHTAISQVGKFTCDYARAFVDDGPAAFKKGDKWGFVDKTGSVVIEAKYEDAKSFSNGVAAVCENGVWNFIDLKGNVVINGEYEDAGYLSKNGVAFVKEDGYWLSLQMHYVEEEVTK